MVLLSVVLIVTASALIWLNIGNAATVSDANPGTPVQAVERDAPEAESVLIAARAIGRGEVITPQSVAVERITGLSVRGVIHETDNAVGRVAVTDIPVGQFIVEESLSESQADAGISALVPAGSRAYAVRVVEEDIIGGFLQAGDTVDVFVTLPGSVYPDTTAGRREGDKSKSTLLLQGVDVLAVGDSLSPTGEVNPAVRTVTLALEPHALARLALAGRLGTVALAIRNPGDDEIVSVPPVALEDLTSEISAVQSTPEAPAPAQRQSGRRITVYSGTEREIVQTAQ